MNKDNIAYCGLVCSLCVSDGSCSCKSENNCGKRLSQEGCYQYTCCREKQLDGCWQCEEAPCGIDMLAKDKVKMRAFVRFIKEYGVSAFCEAFQRTQKEGCIYHRKGVIGDYDLDKEDDVIALLKG